MGKQIATLDNLFTDTALSTQSATDLKAVDDMSKSSSFLKRLHFYSKGKSGAKGMLIEPGHYGIPQESDIAKLGNSVDMIVFVRRAKAMDLSDTKDLVITYDPASNDFKRIVDLADNTKNSGCIYGVAYLVFERTTGEFYEFFCSNKSARMESSKINGYLPVTKALIEAGLTKEEKERGPKPLNMTSKFKKSGTFEYFVPVAGDCLTPFEKLPTPDEVKAQVEKFFKDGESDVEVVDKKEANPNKRKR